MRKRLKDAIKIARAHAHNTGEAYVVVEDAEEPDYYHVVPISKYPYSMLGVVVHIERPAARK